MLELDFAKSVSSFRERTSNIVISSSEFRSCCKTQEIALCLHKHVNGVICSQFFQCIVIKLHRLWKMLYCETKMFSLKSVATSLTDNNYFKYCQITCQLSHHMFLLQQRIEWCKNIFIKNRVISPWVLIYVK